jgi:RNA polymerase sigma factor (sigma-70 family)
LIVPRLGQGPVVIEMSTDAALRDQTGRDQTGRDQDDEDRRVFRAACSGDADAFDVLLRRHAPACAALARRILRDEHMAEDAVQDAFLGAWRFLGRCDPTRTTARAWLLMLTHHKAVDRVRSEERRRARAVTEDMLDGLADDGPGPASAAWQQHRATHVRAALHRLPAAQREVLVLCYFGGLTQREVAARTDAPLGTVKTRALAGLRRLRSEVEATCS